jgi:hypothetical protein
MGSTDWISSFWISSRAVSFLRVSSKSPSRNGRCWAPDRLPPLAPWWLWPPCICRTFTPPRTNAVLLSAPWRTYRTLHTIRPPSHRSELSSTTSSSQQNTSSTLPTHTLLLQRWGTRTVDTHCYCNSSIGAHGLWNGASTNSVLQGAPWSLY